jgi:hypothetical protein
MLYCSMQVNELLTHMFLLYQADLHYSTYTHSAVHTKIVLHPAGHKYMNLVPSSPQPTRYLPTYRSDSTGTYYILSTVPSSPHHLISQHETNLHHASTSRTQENVTTTQHYRRCYPSLLSMYLCVSLRTVLYTHIVVITPQQRL